MTQAILLFLLLAGRQAGGWGLDWIDWLKEKDTMARVKENGYPCEKHLVESKDGYILTNFRIPHGKQSTKSDDKPRPAVILQSGVLCTSDCWVVGNASRALAFVLADNGFDVWMTNYRGNTYSRNHTTLSKNDDKFWDFSLHEMGVYDLPAEIDYILRITGQDKLSFVGHSQGTSSFFIMASSLPEYAAKVNVANNMAPVVFLDHTAGLPKAISSVGKFLEAAAKFLGLQYVLDRSLIYDAIDHTLCRLPLGKSLCAELTFIIGGFDSPVLDYDILAQVADFCPSGTAVKVLRHFEQWTRNGGKFTKFDYEKDNLKYYNSTEPPEYQLSNIVCPIALFYSCKVFISSCPEVKRLNANIPTLVDSYEIPYKKFNHLDFMWATNNYEVVYEELLRVLNKYNSI